MRDDTKKGKPVVCFSFEVSERHRQTAVVATVAKQDFSILDLLCSLYLEISREAGI